MQKVPVEIGLISGKNVQIISDVISGGDEIELDVYKKTAPVFNFWGAFSSMMGGGGNTRR